MWAEKRNAQSIVKECFMLCVGEVFKEEVI